MAGGRPERENTSWLDTAGLPTRDETMYRVGALGLGLVGILLTGCAERVAVLSPQPAVHPPRDTSGLPVFTEEAYAKKPLRVYKIPTPAPGKPPEQTVIGEVGSYRVRKGESLLDIARYFDLGVNEITDANPGVDIWSPPAGSKVVLPTSWVLPCCSYQGLVVNVAELRLYYFEPDSHDPGTTVVRTYPLGLGRDDRRTPMGKFSVTGKTVNPTWVIPPGILRDHIREKGDYRRMIKGGDPDNPLGKYRFELSLEPYRIHGTNIPWGMGMTVSNGCTRLYPEDVELLFPLVPVGTRGEFIYQPIKVGVRNGQVFVEAHPDLYNLGSRIPPAGSSTLKAAGVETGNSRLETVLHEARGVPSPVASEPSRAASL